MDWVLHPSSESIFCQWCLLSRIAFCWLLSRGLPIDMHKLGLESEQVNVEEYAVRPRSKSPRDLPTLLNLSATAEYMKREETIGCESTMVSLVSSSTVTLTVLRTSPAEEAGQITEIIWTVLEGISHLSQRGLEVKVIRRIEKDLSSGTIYVRAKAERELD